jgi:hypothetical protein
MKQHVGRHFISSKKVKDHARGKPLLMRQHWLDEAVSVSLNGYVFKLYKFRQL